MENKKRAYKKRSLWIDVWKRLRKNTTAVVGMIMFLCIFLACFASPLFFSYADDIIAVDVPNQLQGPSVEHIFGTDELGRDIFARVLWGGRTTIFVSFCALVVGFTCGAILGTIAAYYNRYADTIIMRIIGHHYGDTIDTAHDNACHRYESNYEESHFCCRFWTYSEPGQNDQGGRYYRCRKMNILRLCAYRGQAILRLLQATSCRMQSAPLSPLLFLTLPLPF